MTFKEKIKKLDKLVSRYVRLRDSDENGYAFCCTCGKQFHWKDMDAGHYIDRGNYKTRFNERNVNAQCKTCNQTNNGEKEKYKEFIICEYGKKVEKELTESKGKLRNFTSFELDTMIEYYKDKIKKEYGQKR